MVVVFDVQGVPGLALQNFLPGGEGLLHPVDAEGQGIVVGKEAVRGHALELDHHIDLAIFLVDVVQGFLGRHQGGFGDGEAVVVVQHILFEFPEVFVDVGAVVIVGHTFGGGHDMVIRQAFLLGDVGDHVLPEAVHTHVQPEAKNFLHFFPDQRIVHVQIGLLHGEQVQVIFLPHLVPLPCLALEEGVPVVGQLAVAGIGPPDVIVGVRLNALAAFLEPFVLVAGVVDNQIHDDFHVPLMGTVQHLFESLHAAEFRGDVHIVGDVIASVGTGGGVDGGEPDAVAAQALDVVQLFVDTQQVAHTVAVAVLKGPGPDLIEYLVLVPAVSFHSCSTPLYWLRVCHSKK